MSDGAVGRPLWIPFLALAASITIVDQLTKAWLVSFLGPGQSTSVVGDLVRLVHAQNTGGLFGLLRGYAVPFALLSLVAISAIVVFHAKSGRSPLMTLALGLLLGGAIGNLVDRLRLGHVVDWIDAGLGSFRWYTFNVADAAISTSLALLLAMSLWPWVAERVQRRTGGEQDDPAAEHG
ncbi:MAG TPA: signal peptidase II [Candidatus Deferrimicrobiaceae bacterium]|nr:signal peptidase II [Candidatus Deferrimicrobiaceae bacterium]